MKGKIIAVIVVLLLAVVVGCAALVPKPTITEGRIVSKDSEVEVFATGFPEFGQPSAYIIHTRYYIVISDGLKRQKVEVSPAEYEGLRVGWLVDVSKKFARRK